MTEINEEEEEGEEEEEWQRKKSRGIDKRREKKEKFEGGDAIMTVGCHRYTTARYIPEILQQKIEYKKYLEKLFSIVIYILPIESLLFQASRFVKTAKTIY